MITLFFTASEFLFAQKPLENLKKDIVLEVKGQEGTNGLAVAFNPKANVYYSVFAGNENFSLEVHDLSGKSIYSTKIGADLRGFWYNEKKNQLQGILYDNQGSFSFDLTSEGLPQTIKISPFFYGMATNDIACANHDKIYFLNINGISVFKQNKNKIIKSVYPEIIEKLGIYVFNVNGFIHTGVKGYEIGIYHFYDQKLYLIDEATGKTSGEILIDLEENIDNLKQFNISFCNQRLFLFDTKNRTWNGFKIFD